MLFFSFAAACKANNSCFRHWPEDVLSELSTTPDNHMYLAGSLHKLNGGMFIETVLCIIKAIDER